MIRAAELRSIVTEKDQFQASVNLFRDKYFGLPGDLPNATAFWGTMPTGTCSNTSSGASGGTGTQTCNGNGNGQISYYLISGANEEGLLFWQHLANAGMITGQYTGIYTFWGATGQDYPSKAGKGFWWYNAYFGIITVADTAHFEGNYGHQFELRGAGGVLENLIPSEAWGIDKKIDDGLPGVGKIATLEQNGINCNTLAASATAAASTFTYNLGYTSAACSILFKNMW